MNADGTIKASPKISPTSGGLGPAVWGAGSYAGWAVAGLGDVDGDLVPDLAVGASGESAVYLVFLRSDGAVKESLRIGDGEGGLPSGLHETGERLGSGLAVSRSTTGS